jgi:hypothetical protein
MTASPTARLLRLAGFLLVSLLSFAGCARRETTVTTYTLQPQNTRTWVGVHVEDVLARWGEPSEKTSDGEGGTTLTYRSKSNIRVTASAEEPGHVSSRNAPGSGYPDTAVRPAETEIKRAPAAVFYVSPKGVVYRYTISAELLNSGKAPEPPLPETPPGQAD